METVARTPRPTFFLFLFLFAWISFPRNIYFSFASPSHFASQDIANHVLDGIYLIDRLIRALFHTHFRRHVRYHGLLIARWMGYNAISPTGCYAHVTNLRPSIAVECVVAWPSRVNLTRLVFMDFDFQCNRLSCRKSLTDKAVVVSNPHMSLT